MSSFSLCLKSTFFIAKDGFQIEKTVDFDFGGSWRDVYIAFDDANVNVTIDYIEVFSKKNLKKVNNGGSRVGFYTSDANDNNYGDLVVAALKWRQAITPPTPAPTPRPTPKPTPLPTPRPTPR